MDTGLQGYAMAKPFLKYCTSYVPVKGRRRVLIVFIFLA
jgi:hypothetical protein